LADPDALDALITASRPCVSALQAQLRPLLHYHGGVRVFKTRQMMLDVQALVRPR
jgi:DNA repair protein RecO (recombination protein O)